MMCCEPSGYSEDEIDGECPSCGQPTVDGDAYEQCYYSDVLCEVCGWSPCNGGC
jgi:hypothetical protein